MKKPTSVIVGVMRVAVGFNLRGGKKGQFQSCPYRIDLSPKIYGGELAETFLHELNHALWTINAVGGNPNEMSAERRQMMSEEEVVWRIARAQTQFWKDNPDVLRWWASLLP